MSIYHEILKTPAPPSSEQKKAEFQAFLKHIISNVSRASDKDTLLEILQEALKETNKSL